MIQCFEVMPADQNGVNAMKTDIKNTFKTKWNLLNVINKSCNTVKCEINNMCTFIGLLGLG